MRHRNKVKKLGRNASHRKAMLKNMASALIEHHQIKTTLSKAKAAQSYIEKLITFGKNDTVHSRRQAFRFLQNRTLVKALFDDIASTYEDRKGGYTRVIKLGKRRGDGAEMAILQLVGFEKLVVDEAAPKKKRKTTKTASKAAAPAAADQDKKEETVEESAPEAAAEAVEEAAAKTEAAAETATEAVEEAAAETKAAAKKATATKKPAEKKAKPKAKAAAKKADDGEKPKKKAAPKKKDDTDAEDK